MGEEVTMTEKSRNSTHERRYDWIGQKYYITRIEVGNIRSMSQVIMSDFGFIILHPALHASTTTSWAIASTTLPGPLLRNEYP